MSRSMSSTNISLILLNVLISVCSARLPCHFFNSINITNGVWKEPLSQQQQQEPLQQKYQQQVRNHNSIIFDGIEFRWNQYASIDYTVDDGMRNVTAPHIRGCFCEITSCHRLCCSNEQINTNNNDSMKSLSDKCQEELIQIEDEVYDESSKIITLLLGSSIIKFNNKICLPFFPSVQYLNMGLQKNGVETLNSRGYCQTRIDQDTKIHMDVSICITALNMSLVKPVVKTANPNPYETLDRIEHIAMIVSMPFLIITLLLYIWLPSLHRNVHGKCFICYLICQFVCFLVKVINFYTDGRTHLDNVAVYLFLCSFQWLNVTAFDAWWNLRSFKSVSKPSKSSERKRLILYIIYTLLSPLLYFLFNFGYDNLKLPRINEEQMQDLMRGTFIGITFTLNIVFFILTTLKIRSVRNELDHLTSREDSSRHQKKLSIAQGNFQLYLRLFVVMGLTYSISALSYLVFRSSICTEWCEIFLSLQGVWIFLLFVLKRRVLHLIKERWSGRESVSSS